MASISRQPNGRKAIQFTNAQRKRKSVSLGKTSVKQAERVKTHIERLV